MPEPKFEAPVQEIEKKKKPIEISGDKVYITGIEIERKRDEEILSPAELIPNPNNFKDFSLDEFSLDILQKLSKAVVLNQPILLEGEAAIGKSYSMEYLALICNRPVYRMSLNGQTDTSDLIGKWVPRTEGLKEKIEDLFKNPSRCKSEEAKKLIESIKIAKAKETEKEIDPTKGPEARTLSKEDSMRIAELEGIEVPEGDWAWQDGIVPRAMQEGAWLVLDEVNTVEPQILVRLNRVLEKNGLLELHEDGNRMVSRHKDFRFFATTNPPGGRYRGRVPLSAEWLSRWNYQNLGKLPKEVAIKRMLAKDDIALPEIKIGKELSFYYPEAISEEESLHDYYGEAWVKDLMTKFMDFSYKIQELVEKEEIGKNQLQKFDFDQRDWERFYEYLKSFRETDNMKKVIQEAIWFFYLGKCTDEKDKKKIKEIALKLIKVDEPKEIIPQSAEKQKATLNGIKADLLTEDIPDEHKEMIASL